MAESLADLGLPKPHSGRGMLGKAQAVPNSESQGYVSDHERSLQIIPQHSSLFFDFFGARPQGRHGTVSPFNNKLSPSL